MFDKHIEEKTVGMEPKEARKVVEQEEKELHAHLDVQFGEAMTRLIIFDENKETDAYWDLYSRYVENGWLTYICGSKEFSKAMRGRGKFTIIKKKPSKQKNYRGRAEHHKK